jgi:hypothetical protein
MRLRVQDVLKLLASGMSYDDILADYDELEHDDILAVLEYAALDSPPAHSASSPDPHKGGCPVDHSQHDRGARPMGSPTLRTWSAVD